MTQAQLNLEEGLQRQLQTLALTLRPGTIVQYRCLCNGFLSYLRQTFSQIQQLDQLRRTPHIVGWLRSLHQRRRPVSASTQIHYIVMLRRVLADLALDTGCPPSEPLFVRRDIPRHDIYLPKPLSPEDDSLLQEQLRHDDDLRSNAFLLIRMTGLRIGEGRSLRTDSLHHLGGSDWALRVPLGKLHNERWVPVDDRGREIFARILELRNPAHDGETCGLLLTGKNGRVPCYANMNKALAKAAQHAGCSARITPHQLRHTFATTMLRAGVSLLAIKEMLGHRSIAMTMRYVQVSQMDLQREYYAARQKMASLYTIPKNPTSTSRLPAIHHALGEAKHLMEMLRRDLTDKPAQLSLLRLAQRLDKISAQLTKIDEAPK
jgi:site-specific recombinase XerD